MQIFHLIEKDAKNRTAEDSENRAASDQQTDMSPNDENPVSINPPPSISRLVLEFERQDTVILSVIDDQ